LLYLVVFVPAFIYRFSVKSTALIYLPLLWVIRSSTRPNGDFRQWFELQRRDVLEAWRRWYSIGSTFVLFAVPLWLFLFVNDMWTSLLQTVTKNQDPTVRAATALFVFLTPDTITFRSWHLARLANLFLTLWLWVYIERTAVRMAFQPTNERRIEHIISGALLLRGLLGLFVIACNLLILGRAVRWEDLPVVRFIWLP
jgi:hypothetical protein